MRPHIFIATPMFGGTLAYCYHRSMLETVLRLPRNGVDVSECPVIGNGSIPHARSQLLNTFLSHSEFTHIMWIDHDIGWDWRDIGRLVRTCRDFVGGVYRLRCEELQFPVTLLEEAPEMEPDGCIEAKQTPGGFLLVSRVAIDEMVKAYPERRIRLHNQPWDHPLNMHAYNFFDCRTSASGILRNDDAGFCDLYRENGGKIYVLPDIRLVHSGAQDFSGCLADHVTFRKREAV